jgi:hypothetical protein
MKEQLEFEFRSPEEIAEHKKIAEENDKEFEKLFSDDTYIYNKYIDFLLDLIPFRLGWRCRNWPSKIKWKIRCAYQKIRYGVSDDDVFSLGYNIAEFILPRLKYFKKKGKAGIPVCFLPNNYHLLEGAEADYAENAAIKEWDYALDEMIFAFEYTIRGDEMCEIPEMFFPKKGSVKCNSEETIQEKEAWNEYMKKSDEMNARKENGLMLFAKYYDSLWI